MQIRMSLMLIVVLVATAGVHAQVTSRPSNNTPPIQSQSPTIPRFPGDIEEPDLFRENSRQRTRELERQRRIVDDANRLVKLTAQYRNDVEHHGAVTAEDQKLLLQIEKLAREVKDRMRGM